jgi:hypothetical protein
LTRAPEIAALLAENPAVIAFALPSRMASTNINVGPNNAAEHGWSVNQKSLSSAGEWLAAH